MSTSTDQTIYDLLVILVTFVVVAYALLLLVRRLSRSRPELKIGAPMITGLGVRVLAAGGISLLPIASSLRGGDESGIITIARQIAATPLGSADWTGALTEKLHIFVPAAQAFALDSPDFALRITQAGIAVAGLALLTVAVYELAGPRAALIAAWVLALEPANVFFSAIVHKEANLILAGGLVAFGGAKLWKRPDARSLLPVVAGCLIAVATRPYAGWFLIAAGAAITLHAGLRGQRQGSAWALSLVAVVVLFAAVAAPTVLRASTDENLEQLQASQEANVSDDANLSLEEVDFSTRGAIITNLPQRVRDVLVRPYPWQLANWSQRFALLGTMVALAGLALLTAALWRNRGSIMARAGPLVYLGFFVLIAYSLSAGNAGTAFRYRMHIVAIGLCLMAALWQSRTETVPGRIQLVPRVPRSEPIPTR